jgi:hypothetical protein
MPRHTPAHKRPGAAKKFLKQFQAKGTDRQVLQSTSQTKGSVSDNKKRKRRESIAPNPRTKRRGKSRG